MEAKIGPKRSLGGVLGGSGGQEGPKSQKVAKKYPDGPPTDPLDPPKLEPKLIKIGLKSHPKGDHFLIIRWIDFWSDWVRTRLQLGFQLDGLQLGGVQGGPSEVRRDTFWLLFGSWGPLGPPTPPGPLQEASWDRFWHPF